LSRDKAWSRRQWMGLAAGTVVTSGCGYKLGGQADLLPKSIASIAVPAFNNVTTRYKLSDRLPGAIAREFLTRTRYRVVAKPEEADAVLRGSVLNYLSYPTVFSQETGRAATVEFILVLQLSLVERATGKVLFTRPNMDVRQRYEISADQIAYFEESDIALDRLSMEVARSVVSAVLEAF
jgi:outer membrane lipopolysaccharide assembly protein LptE/RlpB